MRRVVITGIGAVTPLGLDATSTWNAMREGRVAIGPIESVPREGLRAGIAAEVHGFDPLAYFDEKKLVLLDRVSQLALVAAREAVAQSGIDFAKEGLGDNTAVVIGTGVGGQRTNDEASRRLYGENNPRLHPLTIVRLMANAPASQISIEHSLRGPSFATVSACASSVSAFLRSASAPPAPAATPPPAKPSRSRPARRSPSAPPRNSRKRSDRVSGTPRGCGLACVPRQNLRSVTSSRAAAVRPPGVTFSF